MADFMFYQPTRIDFGAGKLEKAGEIVACLRRQLSACHYHK